jgi:phosphatidylserine/phosphatidylglycerophosphate/cardiolipin synthase-like enzyme
LDVTEWLIPKATSSSRSGSIQAFFSPDGGCTEAVVSALNGAKATVLVQAYSFTSAPIAKALVDAKRRGIDVSVILDKSQKGAHYSSADFLVHSSVPVWIDDKHAIAHNKIMIIDGRKVITGSFNFTKAAEEKNAENLLVIKNPRLAKEFTQNWEAHRQHSIPYQGR